MTESTTNTPSHTLSPLRRNGYTRTEETTAQILAASSLSRAALAKRAQIRDKDHALFIGEEALVYLIRDFHLRGDTYVVQKLSASLIKRITGPIRSWMRSTGFRYEENAEVVSEATQEVIARLFGGSRVRDEERREGGILDLSSDKSDFAQVRFWRYLKLRTLDVTRAAGTVRDREQITVAIEDVNGHSTDEDTDIRENVPLDGWESISPWESLTQEHEDDLIQAAIRQLPNDPKPYRDVLRLYYLDGWQIEANDSGVVTLSSYFEMTPRTISSWLRIAEDKLRDILHHS